MNRLKTRWATDRRKLIVGGIIALVGIALIIAGSFLPSSSQNAVGWTGVGIFVVAGYVSGWTRGARKKARTANAVSPSEPAGRAALLRVMRFIDEWAFFVGIGAFAWQGSSPIHQVVRLGGIVALLLLSLNDILQKRLRRPASANLPVGLMALCGLGLAFSLASPQPHMPQPTWLTAIAVGCVVLIVAATPYAVVEWRRREDERETAIMNKSLAFAFLVTMTFVLAFSLLEALKIGPQLRADYIIAVAASAWFASWFVLQRRM